MAEEGDGCRENGQGYEVKPVIPAGGQRECGTAVGGADKEQHAEEQYIECQTYRGNLAEQRTVDTDDIDGVGQR